MIDILRTTGFLFLCLCLFNYVVDFIFFLKNRYCRFHIGRWKKDEWSIAIEKTTFRWLKRTPTFKITDNSRYILLDMMTGKYRNSTIQSWQKAALILGVGGCADVKKKLGAKQAVKNYFDTTGMWKKKPMRIDSSLLSYAVLRTVEDSQSIRLAMDYSLEIINSNLNNQGLISYTGNKNDSKMYVDVIGLTVPFLVAYAKNYNVPQYEELGFMHLQVFHDKGLYRGTNLPNHAYDLFSGIPLGVFGWGRGTGWYVLGLIESFDMFTNPDYIRTVKNWIFDAAEEYMGYQRPDGGFGSIIQDRNTYDSSATAVMAYFYAKTSKIFQSEDYYHTAERCLNKIMKCTRITGAIDWCQGDTKAIGVFSQVYDIMPFAQGMTLKALNEMREDK